MAIIRDNGNSLQHSHGRAGIASRHALLVLAAVILAGVTVAVYCQVGDHTFIRYDDGDYVYENSHVNRGLTWKGVEWAFTAFHSANWHPITWLSHMADVSLFGMDAGKHHLTGLAFHVLNSLLILGLLYDMTRRLWPSVLVAGLFALHPMHVESVAWVAERKDVLSTFFGLGAIWVYILFVRNPGWMRYAGAVVLYGLGLMSKPMLVTLPLMLVLIDYWPLERFRVERHGWRLRLAGCTLSRVIIEKVPFILMAAGSCIVTLRAQRQAIHSLEVISLPMRLANAVTSYGWYLWKMAWPTRLSVLYPYPAEARYGLAAVVTAGLAAGTFVLLRLGARYKYLAMGWLWYLLTMLPVIGLVQVGDQAHADRYTYIPSIGIFIMVIWGGAEIVRLHPGWRWVGAVVSGIVLVASCALTWRQTGYWKNDVTLFGRSLAVVRDNYILRTNYGVALAEQGDLDAAMRELEAAVRMEPDSSRTLDSLGTVMANKGKLQEALQWHLKAIEANPESATANYNAGVTLIKLGRPGEALPYLGQASQLKADWSELYMQLGIALARTGDDTGAIARLRQSIELKPALRKARAELAEAYVRQGRWDEAIEQYRASLELESDYDCLNNLGSALVQAGRPEEAEVFYMRAIAARPDVASAYCNLAVVLARLGRTSEAVEYLKEAVKTEPNNTLALKYLDMLTQSR